VGGAVAAASSRCWARDDSGEVSSSGEPQEVASSETEISSRAECLAGLKAVPFSMESCAGYGRWGAPDQGGPQTGLFPFRAWAH